MPACVAPQAVDDVIDCPLLGLQVFEALRWAAWPPCSGSCPAEGAASIGAADRPVPGQHPGRFRA